MRFQSERLVRTVRSGLSAMPSAHFAAPGRTGQLPKGSPPSNPARLRKLYLCHKIMGNGIPDLIGKKTLLVYCASRHEQRTAAILPVTRHGRERYAPETKNHSLLVAFGGDSRVRSRGLGIVLAADVNAPWGRGSRAALVQNSNDECQTFERETRSGFRSARSGGQKVPLRPRLMAATIQTP